MALRSMRRTATVRSVAGQQVRPSQLGSARARRISESSRGNRHDTTRQKRVYVRFAPAEERN
jgi:hypothetical protein